MQAESHIANNPPPNSVKTPMQMNRFLILLLLPTWVILFQRNLTAEVLFDGKIPQVTFAAAELRDAMTETGQEDLEVTIAINSDPAKPEAFQIRSMGKSNIQIIGTDASGGRCMEALKLLSI